MTQQMDSAAEAARRIVAADEALKSAKPGIDYRECAVIWRLAALEGGTEVARALLSSQTRLEKAKEALEQCSASWDSGPTTVLKAAALLMVEFPRRLNIAGEALVAINKEEE